MQPQLPILGITVRIPFLAHVWYSEVSIKTFLKFEVGLGGASVTYMSLLGKQCQGHHEGLELVVSSQLKEFPL